MNNARHQHNYGLNDCQFSRAKFLGKGGGHSFTLVDVRAQPPIPPFFPFKTQRGI